MDFQIISKASIDKITVSYSNLIEMYVLYNALLKIFRVPIKVKTKWIETKMK